MIRWIYSSKQQRAPAFVALMTLSVPVHAVDVSARLPSIVILYADDLGGARG